MKLRAILLIALVTIPLMSIAQQRQVPAQSGDERIQQERDEIREKQKGRFKANWKKPYPNPVRAGIYALALPGAGQIYNKRYWKLPLVWGAVGGVIYAIDYNTSQKNRFEVAYGQRILAERNSMEPFDEFAGIISSSSGIRRFRDQAEKNRELSYVGFVAVYALQALEAYVDAHLKNFDISDDLSLRFSPMWESAVAQSLGPGLSVTLHFD